jgi:hypothetical protein
MAYAAVEALIEAEYRRNEGNMLRLAQYKDYQVL